MKRKLSKRLFLLLLSFCINSWAGCDCPQDITNFIPCPKTYVNPEQIDLRENGIFVLVNDVILQTEGLRTDAQGIYIMTVRDGCGPSQWKCIKRNRRDMVCNTCNWDWNYTCSSCGRDK